MSSELRSLGMELEGHHSPDTPNQLWAIHTIRIPREYGHKSWTGIMTEYGTKMTVYRQYGEDTAVLR